MMGLTPKQRAAKAFIGGFINLNGVAPSYDQIRVALGMSNKSGVNRMIVTLEARGHIRRQPGCARALEIVTPDQGVLRSCSDEDLLAEAARRGLV